MVRAEKKSMIHAYGLALLSGVMLWLCWPHNGFIPLIFIAWIPMLMAEERIRSPYGFFFILWASMLIWNTGTTWWIWNSTGAGAAGAIIANSLLMCLPWMLYRTTRKKWGLVPGLVALALYWISFEYLHHTWDLSWPWLTLGNVFATQPNWIQWYSYTGTTGGSLWVWSVNILVFLLIRQSQTKQARFVQLGLIALLLLPMIVGVLAGILGDKNEKSDPIQVASNVVVVQPNVEPYTEKFATDPNVLVARMIELSESKMDANTRLVVWPETAIPSQAWEHELTLNPVYQPVYAFLQKHPQLLLVTGIDSYKAWGTENPGGFSIRQMNNGQFYEAFNTAMGVSGKMDLQLYHKSKLVPGVESLPSWLGFMGSLFDGFGGISGTLGRSEEAGVFTTAGNPYKAAPIICYESIYGDYVTEYVRSGANILTIVTNDGWWGNTAGHHQHMHYARLRAIETGLWIARSANTGISCFISPKGEIFDAQPWDTAAAIRLNIPPVNEQTFYVKNGDWLSRILWPVAILFILSGFLRKGKNPNQPR